MKNLSTVTNIAGAIAALALITACETTGTGQSVSAQKEAVKGLPQGRCSAVTFNKKLFYVFPTAAKDKFYVGKQKHFDRYKQAIAAQMGSQAKKM